MSNQFKSNGELKAAARGHLEGKYPQSALIIIAFIVCSFFISLISTGTGSGKSIVANLLIIASSIVFSTFPFLLKAGLFHFFIKLCCNAPCNTKDVFCAFTINGKRNFTYALMMVLIENICLLPASCFILLAVNNHRYFLYGGIALIIGFIIYFFIEVCFSQVLFLLFDFPEKKIGELIGLSLYLMKGQKLRYIILVLTFLPLEILGYISCGLGLLWVFPYKYSTLACYYLELTKNSSK